MTIMSALQTFADKCERTAKLMNEAVTQAMRADETVDVWLPQDVSWLVIGPDDEPERTIALLKSKTTWPQIWRLLKIDMIRALGVDNCTDVL